jgi:hypothetical protein
MQLDLFTDEVSVPEIVESVSMSSARMERKLSLDYDSKTCPDCGEHKHLDEYYESDLTIDGRYKRCKDCHKRRQNYKYALMKEAPPQPEDRICQCCGKEVRYEKMHFDECHETETFRGWLCRSCNLGIGQLGDNEEGLLQALAYIQRHKDGLRAAEEANTLTPQDELQER